MLNAVTYFKILIKIENLSYILHKIPFHRNEYVKKKKKPHNF